MKLIPQELQMKINEDSVLIATLKDNDDNPMPKIGVDFGIRDSNIIGSREPNHKETDADGIAMFRIQAKSEGKTIVVAKAQIVEKEAIYASSNVTVEEPAPKPTEAKKVNYEE